MNYDPDYLEHLKVGHATQKRLREERVEEYNKSPSLCELCGKSLPFLKRKHKYCSRTCAVTVNNKDLNRHGTSVTRECLQCGRPIQRPSSKKRFCSGGCASTHKRIAREQEMDAAEDLSKWGLKVVRAYILKRANHACALCGTETWQDEPVPLVLDHVDGNPYNHVKTNLRAVCAMCDALLPTYKGRNKGGGRHTRRQRYHQGLSY